MPARIAHTTAASVVFTPNFARICANSLFKVRGLIPNRAAAAPTSPQYGAQTTYTYYAGTDRVWKITDALNHTWEYSYTSYGDVKSVQDPENATTVYVYDYESNEPAYGKVRAVIDPMGRATQYEYYPASDANLARRGQLKKVIAPGGFWRELDYGGAGWLTRRTVQTGANESETTTYTYDSWGRLRLIDYPRSADVSMGYDGESRRVWVQDGVGRREYTYDAWGRVTWQRGCCGSEPGIEVVAVSAEYDAAGRKLYETERRADDSAVRTIQTDYDPLGRMVAIGDYDGAPPARNQTPDFRRRVVYFYSEATGRLEKEQYAPNSSYVEYTYYGADAPTQRGFVWKVEHKKPDGSLLIGYEYTYDLLGRVVQSVERPSGDTTAYAYTPAGRLESEARTGQVGYFRYHIYNLNGTRAVTMRDDTLRGFHIDVYVYDELSGRLTRVEDMATGQINYFERNPDGALRAWTGTEYTPDGYPVAYHRFYEYNESGALTRFWRAVGNNDISLLSEYRYNGDGVLYATLDYTSNFEYRFLCGLGCSSVVSRIYVRLRESSTWDGVNLILNTPNARWFTYPFEAIEHVALNGVWYHRSTAGMGMQEEDPIIGGYLIDLDISDVSNEIPSIRPPRFPVRPHPPFFHPIPPSLDLPRPWFARNIIDLILNPCIIKGAFASIVTFPPIFDETVPDYPIVGPIYPPTVQSPQAPSPSRPSRPTAPRGWIPIYGNWCGLGHPPAGNRPPLPGGGIDLMDSMAPLPIDALDSCCFNHDDCFEQHNCSGIRLEAV